jgi:hypothetical protein
MRSRIGGDSGCGNEGNAGHWKTGGRWDGVGCRLDGSPERPKPSSNIQLLNGALDTEGAWRPVALTLPRISLTWGYNITTTTTTIIVPFPDPLTTILQN